MKIETPNDRSANLWLAEGVRVGVTRLGRQFDEDGSGGYVVKYGWQVTDTTKGIVEGDDTLHAGTDNGPVAMLGTLLAFLVACGEAYAHKMREPTSEPENLTLYPESMREWCYQWSDELQFAEGETWRIQQGWRTT